MPSSLLLPYIPRRARDAYIALRAFNIEVARTADTTSTSAIGRLRLQFHRDLVTNSLAGTPPAHPVAILLASAAADIAAHPGSTPWRPRWFLRAIDARERNLTGVSLPSMAALEEYGEHAYSSLMYLTLQAVPVSSLTADHVASHVGKAVGIAAVLRGLPLLAFPAGGRGGAAAFSTGDGTAQRGSVALPVDAMVEAGMREEDVLRRGAEAPGLRDAVFSVATRANDHLITARRMMAEVSAGRGEDHPFEHAGDAEFVERPAVANGETPTQELERAFGVFMPAVATQVWLDALQKQDFDIFAPKLRVTDWRLPWRAFWAYRRRRI